MKDFSMEANKLVESFDQNGVLGKLTNIDEKTREQFFRQTLSDIQDKIEKGKEQARAKDESIILDASALSGVNLGDRFVISPDKTVRRELEPFPQAENILRNDNSPGCEHRPCRDLSKARPLLARAAYNGLWSPSGTNWQPNRSMECTPQEIAQLLQAPQEEQCGLLVFARRKYQSILQDIASLCAFSPRSHAESIDLGIWLHACEQTAKAHGWRLVLHPFPRDRQPQVSRFSQSLLADRKAKTKEPYSISIGSLLSSLKQNDHFPFGVLTPFEGKPLSLDDNVCGGLLPSDFDQLVEARCTQRVASPSQDLLLDVLTGLFLEAKKLLPKELKNHIGIECYTWHDRVPKLVGQAMHQGIEGEDGLVSTIRVDRIRRYLESLTESKKEEKALLSIACKKTDQELLESPFPVTWIPKHLALRFQTEASYRREGEFLLDYRGRVLTCERLIKWVRLIVKSFGKYFLSFHNTHPLLGIIWARPLSKAQDQPNVYYQIGRIVAHMTLLARARGFCSIIKSGPIEIANKALQEIVNEQDNKTAQHPKIPVVTFQMGKALGPEEWVGKDKKNAHQGLMERLLDRRSTRESLKNHYIPVY